MACRKFRESIGPRCGRVNDGNSGNCRERKWGWPKDEWGASVARCPPDRAYVRCLGGSSECNGVIVSTCEWPVTAEPYRAKTAPLPRSSILVRPHRFRPRAERNGGGAGYCPGSETLMPRGVYRHSRLPDTFHIGASAGFLKASRRLDPFLPAAADSPHKARRNQGQRNDAPLQRPAGRNRPGPGRRPADLASGRPGAGGDPVQGAAGARPRLVRVVDYMGDDAAVVQAAR